LGGSGGGARQALLRVPVFGQNDPRPLVNYLRYLLRTPESIK